MFNKQKLLGVLAVSLLALNAPAYGKAWVEETPQQEQTLAQVVKNETLTLRTETAFSEIKVGNPDVADIVVLSDKSFHIVGKGQGRTSVLVYDKETRLADVIDVRVNYDVQGLKKSLFETYPNEKIAVSLLAGQVYLTGNVSSDNVAVQAEKIAQAYGGPSVTNGLVIHNSHQVLLEVRFVEASRSAIKELGIGLLTQQAGQFDFQSGTGVLSGAPTASAILSRTVGATNINVRIDAMEEKGIIRTLAEPNLVSMSGETASFLAGGEFPVPIQGELGDVTIEYRQFGVGLSFTPTVLNDGIVNLKVAPEVSQLDPTNSVRVGGVEVPSLTIRRANTTVELRNGQSFAVAGLLQHSLSDKDVKVPWLGDVPVLGSLFSSKSYRKKETELVIIVTPRLVKPVSDISQLATPLDGLTTPSDAQFFLGGQLEGPRETISSAPKTIVQTKTPTKTRAAGGLTASSGYTD